MNPLTSAAAAICSSLSFFALLEDEEEDDDASGSSSREDVERWSSSPPPPDANERLLEELTCKYTGIKPLQVKGKRTSVVHWGSVPCAIYHFCAIFCIHI